MLLSHVRALRGEGVRKGVIPKLNLNTEYLIQRFQPLLKENRETLLAPKAPASRGVRGHAPPPGKFCKFRFSQMPFPAF